MQAPVKASKAALRQRIADALARMPAALRTSGSAQARGLLARHPLWRGAKSILFYAPMPGELDVWPLLEEALKGHKLVALPRFSQTRKDYEARQVQDPARDVARGQFGIREPGEGCVTVSLEQIDLILVPGVAFDCRGYRLGRGKGYYDRLLRGYRGIACGVGFDEQLAEAVPVEPHDFRLNCILTPTRWIEPKQANKRLE